MDPFNAARRELLRFGGIGLAAAASTAVPAAYAAQLSPNAAAAQGIFDIRTYGAVGDGKAVDSPAINKAIEAAAEAGGGTVLFPAGTWLSFSIRLKSHVALHLSQGATILAADSPLPGATTGYNGGTYDAAEPNTAWDAYQDYGHNHWHNSLIWGEGINDVSITGPGLIFGKGLSYGAGPGRVGPPREGFGPERPAGAPAPPTVRPPRGNYTMFQAEQPGVGNKAIALGYNRPTENLTITNCYVAGSYELGTMLDGTYKKFAPDVPSLARNGRIKCGTESNGGFKNITISNCVFEGCMGLALESEDGALCEDIAISNITMRDVVSAPLFWRLGARLRGPKESTKVGTLQRVVVDNLVSYNTAPHISSILSGIPDHTIRDVKISNVYIQHGGGGTSEDAKIAMPENAD